MKTLWKWICNSDTGETGWLELPLQNRRYITLGLYGDPVYFDHIGPWTVQIGDETINNSITLPEEYETLQKAKLAALEYVQKETLQQLWFVAQEIGKAWVDYAKTMVFGPED